MRPGVTAAVFLFVLASPSAAQSFGAGNTTCAQFLRAARSGDILYHQASNWLLGYVSGMNTALKAAKAPTPAMNLTSDQVMKSAADYCEAHPTATIAAAAAEWYPSLPKEAEAPQSGPPSRSWMLDLNARPSLPGGRRGP
jgi:hypothetical protein